MYLLRVLFIVLNALPLVFCELSPGDARPLNSRAQTSYLDTLSRNQKSLFSNVMKGLDVNYGPPFLFNSARYSAWYAVGLLARNEGKDVETASQIIKDAIALQYNDPSKVWFGTFKDDPSEPNPGSVYPPSIYHSYDPNRGLFVCTSWIIVMEEFQHLLEPSLVMLMKRSMYNATVGDGYRVGGVDSDNLYAIYSNPWLMRVMAATYVGHMQKDANMSFWGDEWARQAIVEFDRFGTLSEFNSGTYTGVSLYALSLWGYMPKNSTIVTRAKDLIRKTWLSIGELYNPTLNTLGGPWDRAYGFDMQAYVGILGAQITGLIGGLEDKSAPLPYPLVGSKHYGDAAAFALTPLVAKFHDPLVPSSVLAKLKKLDGKGHTFSAHAVSPPFEVIEIPRNYTSWTADGLSVGGVQIDGRSVGGAAISPTNFAPASILWNTGVGKTGWISHYSTSRSISAIASPHNLTVSYPPSRIPLNSTEQEMANAQMAALENTNIMTFLISGIQGITLDPDFLTNGTGTFPGLRLTVSGNVHARGNMSLVYGGGTLNDLSYYNLSYAFSFEDGVVPEVVFGFEKL